VATVKSILNQNFNDFELIINDDKSTDNTIKLIQNLKDSRIKIHINQKNLGYSLNLEAARKYVTGKYIYLMGQDDILAQDSLKDTYDAFEKNLDVGAVTRPYYWFFENITTPVRYKIALNQKKSEKVYITDSKERVIRVFDSLDQLSGLSYRTKFVDIPFHPDIFPCHIYPFSSIFLKHPVMYLKNYNVAVRIASSQTRKLSSIYNRSPLQSWVDMALNLKLPKYIVTDFIAVNYVGLVQIKNYSLTSNLYREILLLIKHRPLNLISPIFWMFTLGCIFIPRSILIPMVDWYKNSINTQKIPKINFKLIK
jgi:glycosyltransferase involved in cell wall biosynthesis